MAVLVTFALLIITIFLISNTIKLSINAKREEITIMRLVGATNWTIRGPFLAEGFIIGLTGSLIALMFSGFLYNYVFHMESISFLASYIIDPYYMNTRFLIFTPLIGILIGVCGSYNAIRSYLKV
ncbi:MAG: FtsX-like permease family protein [Mycoplasmatales bacterium]